MTLKSPPSKNNPLLKVAYLLCVSVAAFSAPFACKSLFLEMPFYYPHLFVGMLLTMQVILLVRLKVSWQEVRATCKRIFWLLLFLLVIPILPGLWEQSAQKVMYGLLNGTLMSLQVATLISTSLYVQSSGSPNDLVDGLRTLRLPKLFIYSLNNTLALVGKLERRKGQGKGRGQGRANKKPNSPTQTDRSLLQETADQLAELEHTSADSTDQLGPMAVLRRLLRGDLTFFIDAIQLGLKRASDRLQNTVSENLDPRQQHDIAWISGIAILMASVKILKVLPGVAFASGFKTLLLIPMYLLASHKTHSRWGGSVAGALTGILGMMMGDALLEVPKHIVAGFLIDLFRPVTRFLPPSRLVYCFVGLIAGFCWVAMDYKVAMLWLPALTTGELFHNPAILIPRMHKVLFTLIFSTLSGFLSYYTIRTFNTSVEQSLSSNYSTAAPSLKEPESSGPTNTQADSIEPSAPHFKDP